jgi:predicted HAD superfamily Cof-like phosphohydrolase
VAELAAYPEALWPVLDYRQRDSEVLVDGRQLASSPSSKEEPAALGIAEALVREFQQLAGQPAPSVPCRLSASRLEARIKWMQEELLELKMAKDLHDEVDALLDLIYFALGTLVEMGIAGSEPFRLIHNANMRKIGARGERKNGIDGKLGKPQNWVDPRPDVAAALVRRHTPLLLTIAEPHGCLAASLHMALQRLKLEVPLSNIVACLPPVVLPAEAPEARSVGVTLPTRDLTGIVSNFGAIDDFVPIEMLDEAAFPTVLEKSLLRYAAVGVAFDSGIVYGQGTDHGHFTLVAAVDGDDVLLVDAGPETCGLQSVRIFDLYAGMKRRGDGVHRFAAQPSGAAAVGDANA